MEIATKCDKCAACTYCDHENCPIGSRLLENQDTKEIRSRIIRTTDLLEKEYRSEPIDSEMVLELESALTTLMEELGRA